MNFFVMYFLYYVTPLWKFCSYCVHTYVIILHLNHTICPFPTPTKYVSISDLLTMTAVLDLASQFYKLKSFKMEQIINTFLDKENLPDQNSLTHLLDFYDEFSDLTNTVKTSRYYSSAGIIQKIKSSSCTIMSINCQSLNAKFSKIKLLIDTFAEYGKPIQVLCIQETMFENTNLIDIGQFHIDNYHLLTKNRYASDHGGLACYIHKHWNYTIKPTLVEMFVEISNPDNPKSTFTVGIFYRPPHIAAA